MIKQLPNRYNMFTEKGFAMYVLDDCSVHLIPEVRLHIHRKLRIWSHLLKKPLMENFIFHAVALFKKRYILVINGGGITGDIQINDTSCHHHLKSHYQEFEKKTMLEELKKDPYKISSPSRNEVMHMLQHSWDSS